MRTRTTRKTMLAFLASEQLDKVAGYAARGRKHKFLSDEELSAGWIQEFRKMALDPRDWKPRSVWGDFDAEFDLRNKEPPFKLVKQEFRLFREASAAAFKTLEIEEDSDTDLNRDIEAFKTQKRS